jgi:hypothetical protein
MTDPLVVLILVAANGGTEPATSSMTASAHQALGASTVLLLEERASLPPDEEAVKFAQHLRAGALVEIDWIGSSDRYAFVHVHLAQGPGWADRRIDFAKDDPATECGRTIGFAAASMITRLSTPQAIADRPTEPPPPSVEPSPAAPPPPAPPPPSTPPPAPALRAPAESHNRASEVPPSIRRGIEVVALGASPPTGFGATASAFGRISKSVWGQLSAGARLGQIPSTQGTFLFSAVQLGGGVTWTAARWAGTRPFEVDLRGDLFGTDLIVSRGNTTQSRWVPEARAQVEGCWLFLAPSVGFLAAAGVEATIGTTDVAVGNHIVATIHPFRAIGAVGLRVRF